MTEVIEKPDKRRTPPGNKSSNFRLRESGFEPPFDKVTAVATIAFTPDGMIVAAEENRGPDLPGGHVQEDENDAETTARRESREETGIELGTITLLRAIESDRYGSEPEDLTYMLIVTALVTEQGPVPAGMQKHIMSVDEFKQKHRGLRKEMIRTLVDEAFAIHFPDGIPQAA
jgi:ADP-ribose pyrophosphatase YjhB (NUDIX family)